MIHNASLRAGQEESIDLEMGGRINSIGYRHLPINDNLTIPQDEDDDDVNEEHKDFFEHNEYIHSEEVTVGEQVTGNGTGLNMKNKDCLGPSPSSQNNYHAVLQVSVPNEHRRFYEKAWLPKVFQKLSTFQGFR